MKYKFLIKLMAALLIIGMGLYAYFYSITDSNSTSQSSETAMHVKCYVDGEVVYESITNNLFIPPNQGADSIRITLEEVFSEEVDRSGSAF